MNPVRKCIFSLLLILVFQWGRMAFCQDLLPRFRHFGTKEGLSTSAVTSICQDHEGKIWIGTADGLNCHYGTFFKAFFQNKNNENGLKQSSVTHLATNREGNIWISMYGGGINLLDPIRMKFLPLPAKLKKLKWLQANTLALDFKGRLWAGYYEGLLMYDPSTDELDTLSKIPDNNSGLSVTKLAVDVHGNVFAATPFEGLLILNADKGKIKKRITSLQFPFPFHRGELAFSTKLLWKTIR